MHDIRPEKLTGEGFERFGVVIEATDHSQATPINAGTSMKYGNLAIPDCSAEGGQASLHLYRAHPMARPFLIRSFERHRLGSQAFVPLNGKPYLVVVSPSGPFRLDHVRVFRAEGTQGIQYRRGVWHHFCLALEPESDFLVIDRLSPVSDCDEHFLSPEQCFTIAA